MIVVIPASVQPRFNHLDACRLLILIVGRIGTQALLYSSGFQSLTADEFGRIVVAARWSESPFLVSSGPWLPFHAYFYGMLIYLTGDMLWAPRIAAVLFGAISIALMYFLTLQLFKRRSIALLSAFLMAVNPAHVWLSSVPLTEITQLMLLCAFAWLYARWQEDSRDLTLLAGATCLGMATAVRVESWLFGVMFSVLLVAKHLQQQRSRARQIPFVMILLAMVILWSFPLYWLVSNLMQSGNPLAFLEVNRQFDFRWYGDARAYDAYLRVYLQLDPIMALVTAPAIVAVIIRRPYSAVQHALLVFGALMLYVLLRQGHVQPLGNYIRYLAVFQLMTYPLVAWFVVLLIERLIAISTRQRIVLVMITMLISMMQLRTAFNFVIDPSADGLRVGQLLRIAREHNKSHPAIALIELNHFQYLATHVGANDIDNLVYDRPLNLAELNNTASALTPAVLHNCHAKYQFGYAIARAPQLKQMIEGAWRVRAINTLDGYTLYEVISKPNLADPYACSLNLGRGF